MNAINRALQTKIVESEGRYLDMRDLQPLELYVQSYTARLQTYQALREQSVTLIGVTLRRLGQEFPDLIRQHGKRCQYDMTEVLRYIALSILKDDDVFFQEQVMAWLDTVLVAHKRHEHCSTAYHYLQEAINASLPPAGASLIYPYLEGIRTTLHSHA